MNENVLPDGFEWCRKNKYEVQIELGCYSIDDEHPLLEGFEEKIFYIDGIPTKYAIKHGFNFLERNHWTTSPMNPFIITGTVGEQWPVNLSNLTSYEVNPNFIDTHPLSVFTKDPSNQEFMVAFFVPIGTSTKVIPSSAFLRNGTIDENQILVANAKSSPISHHHGDYVVAKHIPGKPEYMELSEEERNTLQSAKLYDPRIINGNVMDFTYDRALIKSDILKKYYK